MKKIFLVMIGAAMMMTACNNNGFDKTESGIEYKKHITAKDAQPVQEGNVIFIQAALGTKDSIFQETSPEVPMLLSKEQMPASLYEVLSLLNVGDSMTALLNPVDFFGSAQNVPPFFGENDKLYFHVQLNKTMTMEEYEAEEKAKAEARFEEEKVMLQEYMTSNNLEGAPTESGLILVTIQEGKGQAPIAGQNVKVHYTGYLLDGTKFDSSVDRNEPFEFPLGMGRVIRGWDEGVALMKVGGKAKLLIPSTLAYGSRDMGVIPSNSPLVFDVELIEVSAAPEK
ncbi:MAG: FKBP-type peptidyl-prolyl cis-trans isomerase [Bacteroidales bacterium]|nr:FKBP-type peptidyl-prolyl cis-trans isomerase [Bacteroidales bacterium]